MKSTLKALVAAVSIAVAGMTYTAVADAATIAGTVSKVSMAADGKSAVAVVKESSGKEVSITISDSETLEQIKAKRIAEGDQVRGKYDVVGGKNEKGSLRKKTAGC